MLAYLVSVTLLLSQFIPAGAQVAHSTTHRLETKEKVGVGICSATAIALHSLLTATHCVADGLAFKVDGEIVVVQKVDSDGADHSILTLRDDTTFTSFATVNLSGLHQGDHVYMWGNPDGLPDQYREGYVTGMVDDAFTLDLNGYFGDSGAGLFNDKGEIVGVISLIHNSSEGDGSPNLKLMGVLPFKFSPDQIN